MCRYRIEFTRISNSAAGEQQLEKLIAVSRLHHSVQRDAGGSPHLHQPAEWTHKCTWLRHRLRMIAAGNDEQEQICQPLCNGLLPVFTLIIVMLNRFGSMSAAV